MPVKKPHGRFRYTLAESDLHALREFTSKFAAAIPPKPTGHHSDKGWVALKFYFRALFDASDQEECIALAVACLDGIFSDQKHDLIRQVSQRAAAFLRLAGLNGPDVYRDITDAFKIRNTYNHGDQVKRPMLQKLPALAAQLLEYARLAVLKDLELHLLEPKSVSRHRQATTAATKRKKLGERLDASLLDDGVLAELRDELGGGIWEVAGPKPIHSETVDLGPSSSEP